MNTMLTVAEAAKLANISPGAIRRWCANGELKHVRIGKAKRLINNNVFEEFLQGKVETHPAGEVKSGNIRRIFN